MDRKSILPSEYELVKVYFGDATDFAIQIAKKYDLDINFGSFFLMKYSYGSIPVIKRRLNDYAVLVATNAVVWDKAKIEVCSYKPVHTMKEVDICLCKMSKKLKMAVNQLKLIELENDFKE